jgi:hypothetical protein
MIVVGVLCILGMAGVIVEMTSALEWLPPGWWLPEDRPRPPGTFEFREAWIHPGLFGWLGGWGYLASWIWLPLVAWQLLRAKRRGLALRPVDRVLPIVVALQIVAVQCLLRLTPLRYGYPLI